MADLTERQIKIAGVILRAPNGITNADTIAAHMGYKPARGGRLAVSRTLRIMAAIGVVHRLPPKDQWGHAEWALSPAGRAAIITSGRE